jgi:protein involved in sex pheromone biosynthesis
MKKLNIILVLTLSYVMMSCSSHPKESEVIAPAHHKSTAEVVGIETQQVAMEQNAQYVTELSFKKNKSFCRQQTKQNFINY